MEELDSLRQKLIEKKQELLALKEQNKKNRKKRIAKTTSLIARIAIPAILATGAVVGGIHFLGGGYPFKQDSFNAYERYSIESTYDGEITSIIDYSYENKKIEPLLVIYSPYKKDGDSYSRNVVSYSLEVENEEDLYNAIKNKDIDYIKSNIKQIDERVETVNEPPVDNSNHMIANFTYLSNNFVCEIPEPENLNTEITLMEIYLSIFLSFILSAGPIMDFGDKRKEIKNKYPIENPRNLISEINTLENTIAKGEVKHVK